MSTLELGRLVQTAGIANKSESDSVFAANVLTALRRYLRRDWGDLCDEDKAMNDNAVESGDERIVASYRVPDANAETSKVYIISEYDRSVTTILFADEY